MSMSSGSPFHNDTAWQPSPIHTPTPGHFNPLLNQLDTPGTPTPTDLRLNPAYNFHRSLFPNPYPFSNSLGTPPGTYHPYYYYTPPASAAHMPYTLPLHNMHSTTLNAPSADNHPSQTAAPAKHGQKCKDPTQGGRASKQSKTAASAPGSSSSATPASAPLETPTSVASVQLILCQQCLALHHNLLCCPHSTLTLLIPVILAIVTTPKPLLQMFGIFYKLSILI